MNILTHGTFTPIKPIEESESEHILMVWILLALWGVLEALWFGMISH